MTDTIEKKVIPKVVHYCWFGHNPLPQSAKLCIDSWKKYLPDYEIKEWNEGNFDVNSIPYTAEAYKLKKYAFVSDYARFLILNKFGGLYFDTDVEIVAPLDDIVENGPFMGCERIPMKKILPNVDSVILENAVNPGVGMGAIPGMKLFDEVLKVYEKKHFVSLKGNVTGTIVHTLCALLVSKKIEDLGNNIFSIDGLTVYPVDYFCPKDYYSGEMIVTRNTVCVHHYSATWVEQKGSCMKHFFQKVRFLFVRLKISLLFNVR